MLNRKELVDRLAEILPMDNLDYGQTMAELILRHPRPRVKELRGLSKVTLVSDVIPLEDAGCLVTTH